VDHRDLTIWLAEELRWNGFEATLTMRPLLTSSSQHCNAVGLALWLSRVADDHLWDFKDQVQSKLERTEKVLLRHQGDEYAWYERSVPGNINFGYAGMAAGWDRLLLHAGASFAEITDAAHRRRGEATCVIPGIPDGVCPKVYLNPQWVTTLFDDPKDFTSVEFGIQLWERYPIGLTVDQLREFLTSHGRMLSTVGPPPHAGNYRNDEWPYWRGYFNGPRSDPWPLGWPPF
jgi:hypothetical protein